MTAPSRDPLIRIATPEDARAIAQVHVASWRESYDGLVPEPMLATLSVEAREHSWRAMLADLAASGHTAILVAEDDGAIVGFAACGRQREAGLAAQGYAAEIGSIYVLQRCQRRQLGTRLMHAAFGALAEAGFEGASLWVLRDNAPARHFYERLGGNLIGQKADQRGSVVLPEVAYGWRDLGVING
ncbi:GNAT family N-acetyltransferase [Bosea sp. BH3]|uniref:GNAT family N-acetyltransferase n=1 Tax=Bosea sp. BH3 TaxID=2871701 RepID=UPI0021CB3908|nr:GNAT family N-acetyltransferase [Bosea sp. BH3]MCU4178011.1 GNAT family N-acetyltransferase [Bosea sp. BH3]